MNCPSCSRENPPNARFCVACGQPVSTCSQCGTELVGDASFCHGCGAAIDAPSTVIGRQQARPPEVERAPPQPSPPSSARPAHMPSVPCVSCGRKVGRQLIACPGCGTPVGYLGGTPIEMSAGQDAGRPLTMSLEDFLQRHLRPQDLAFAIRKLGLPRSRSVPERMARLVEFAEQRANGTLDILEAMRPDDLTRVCRRLGIETGTKAEMVERIDDRIEVIRGPESVDRVQAPNRLAPPRRESPSEVVRLVNGALAVAMEAVLRTDPTPNESEFTMYGAWMTGGSYLASTLIEGSETLGRAWGKGDEHKAMGVLEVCTLAMISRWYEAIDSHLEHSEDERRRGREISATNVLSLFGSYSPEALGVFMNLDIQFDFDSKRTRDNVRLGAEAGVHSFLEMELRMWQAAQACGSPMPFDLSNVAFPITSYLEVVTAGIHKWDSFEMLAVVPLAFIEAQKETRRWLRKL